MKNRYAMVLAHPGHELMSFHYLQQYQPTVHVLTDGSGRNAKARINSTKKIIDQLGATPGELFGEFTDLKIYDCVLQQDKSLFWDMAIRLANSMIEQQTQFVVGDAEEGRIMSHELFRAVRFSAIRMAEKTLGYKIRHYEFIIDQHPHTCPAGLKPLALMFELTDQVFQKKLDYALNYQEMKFFVDKVLGDNCSETLSQEQLFPAIENIESNVFLTTTVPFETHGEALVEQGKYPEVIRYQEHLLPIIRSLHQREQQNKAA